MTPSGGNYDISIFTKELVGPLFCLIFTSVQQSFTREINERAPRTKKLQAKILCFEIAFVHANGLSCGIGLNKLQTNNIAKIVVTWSGSAY